MSVPDTDVLIIGGGPAGLLAAAYLAPEHRVALLERGTLGRTSKFWVTTQRRLSKHRLGECVLSKPDRMIAGTFLGGHTVVSGDFAVADDELVLQVLLARCRDHGVNLMENCNLLNLSWARDRIQVFTTRGDFSARLLIDATGGASPIAQTFQLHRLDGFYAVYGSLLRYIELHSRDIVLGHVSQLGNPPPVLEVIPTGEDQAYCVVFLFSKTLLSPTSLAESFDSHCRHNPFFRMTSRSERGPEKSGAIPIGRGSRRRLRGVIPLGEAAMMQPPLMATAFNELLEHSESICRQISESLCQSSGVIDLQYDLYPLRKRAQDRLQLLFAKLLIGASVEGLDKFVRIVDSLPESLRFKFLSNELSWYELANVGSRVARELTISAISLSQARA